MTDVIAGREGGRADDFDPDRQPAAPPIETAEPLDPSIKPEPCLRRSCTSSGLDLEST